MKTYNRKAAKPDGDSRDTHYSTNGNGKVNLNANADRNNRNKLRYSVQTNEKGNAQNLKKNAVSEDDARDDKRDKTEQETEEVDVDVDDDDDDDNDDDNDNDNDASLASTKSISSTTTTPTITDDETEYSCEQHQHQQRHQQRQRQHNGNGNGTIPYNRECDLRRLPKHYKNSNRNSSSNSLSGTGEKHNRPSHYNNNSHNNSNSNNHNNNNNNNNHNSQQQLQRRPSSTLSTEIARFQKMVTDLEASTTQISGTSSPGAMWKSRILLRSCRDAEQDLRATLGGGGGNENDDDGDGIVAAAFTTNSNTNSNTNPQQMAARKKLLRDFRRVSEHFRSVVGDMELKQRAAVSILTATDAADNGNNNGNDNGNDNGVGNNRSSSTSSNNKTQQLEEDFFERAMRERNQEVQKISDGMKKVHEIYQDLAGLVDGQQEQIDQIEDANEDAKVNTRAGLEEIQHGMWKLCVADANNNNNTNNANNSNNRNKLHNKRSTAALIDLEDDDPTLDGHGNLNSDHRRRASSNPSLLHLDSNNLLTCMMCQGRGPSQHGNGNNNNNDSSSIVHNAPASRGWKSPLRMPPLPSKLRVQESAQDVYQCGHAMVGGIVDQVHEATNSASVSVSSPSARKLRDHLREVRNRIYCTPQPRDIDLYDYYKDDDNGNNNDNSNNNNNGNNNDVGDYDGVDVNVNVNVNVNANDSATTDETNAIGKEYFQIEETTRKRSPGRRSRSSNAHGHAHDREKQRQRKHSQQRKRSTSSRSSSRAR